MDIQDPALFTPQCRVFIDGVQIKNSAEMIESVTVRLSVSEMANSCEIAIFCDFDHDKSTVGGIIATASPFSGICTPDLPSLSFPVKQWQ